MMSELKPCPFCGGKAELLLQWKSDEGTGKKIWARCEICGMVTSNYGTEEEAEDAWNRRARPANEPIECHAMERVEGGIPYCTDKQTACDGCNVESKENDPHGLQTTWETPESCPNCMEHLAREWSYCPECGRPTDWSPNEPLCGENENFIQTKYGYCFYALNSCPFVYNLYVHPQYRRYGHSKTLLRLVIGAIRKEGYYGEICIQAKPREDSIKQEDLMRYYRSLGFTVCEGRPPERSEDK